jgi:hypothetical protein
MLRCSPLQGICQRETARNLSQLRHVLDAASMALYQRWQFLQRVLPFERCGIATSRHGRLC